MPQFKAKSKKDHKCVFCLKQNVELFIVPEYSRSDFGGFVDVEKVQLFFFFFEGIFFFANFFSFL